MNRNEKLFEFIAASPTAFHAVKTLANELEKSGYTRLYEEKAWQIESGKYYVTRNDSSIIALNIPEGFKGFNIMATHTDSPCFKVKANPTADNGIYTKLNTEKYGGGILSTWLDRPLSLAGRITRRTEGGIVSELWASEKPVCIIPSVAPHLDRESSAGRALDMKSDMMPLLGAGGAKPDDVRDMTDLLGYDLYLYNPDKGTSLGANGEFIASPRLDNLQCTYGALTGLLEAVPTDNAAVFCAFDNEEVGSSTKQGADSDFLEATLTRICESVGMGKSEYYMTLSNSFLMSADNAHALHPNHPELSDGANAPKMNGGVVVKYNANQKYTTDSVSAAVTVSICEKAGVPHQVYANRSDKPGGSTLGNIASTHVSVMSADIGLAQLSMHSAFESAGALDTEYFHTFAREYFSSAISSNEGKIVIK